MNDTEEPRHRIGTVARMTGISAHSLRAWERRYGALAPERTPAGDRLYTEADVRRLRRIKRLIEYGHSIGNIARLDEVTLDSLLAEHHPLAELHAPGAEATVNRYLDALGALDLDSADRILTRAAISLEPRAFIESVAQPLLSSIGKRWQTGDLCVAHEHAASAMLRTQLGTLLSELPVEPGSPVAVVGTPAGERHEFGALFAAVVAALGGYRAVYLGPDLPASEIVTAVKATGAVSVLLSVVSLSAKKARPEIVELRTALARRTRLAVGGKAAGEAVQGVAHVARIADLVELAEWLTRGGR